MDRSPDDNKPRGEADELKKKAIKFKAFQHTFSERDVDRGLDEKLVLKKLKASEQLESSYNNYLKQLEKNPIKPAVFPWDSPMRRMLYWCAMKIPAAARISTLVVLSLLVVNYIPGPTQHIVEFILARAIYDTAHISRIPDNLETYAHSANIVDASGGIIKSYGKRSVTTEIPNKVKQALLACEDHYLLPNPHYPWYVNSFLIHAGVSWFNLLGAVKDTLMGHTRGASTIVMQNAKKILGNERRTIANKLEEIIVSYMLVSKFGKEKNLDFYINTVPVGSNIYGFAAAARNYFKKELSELNYQQLVTIGSFIPNHNRQLALYDIWRGKNFDDLSPGRRHHAKSAILKVNMALRHLRAIGEISADELKRWLLSDEESIRRIGFRDFTSPLYGEEEWTSWNVIREVCSRNYFVHGRQISGERLLLDEKGDVVIETEVDLALVEKIKEIITDFLNDPAYKKILRRRNEKTWKKDLALYERLRRLPPYDTFDDFMKYLYRHINIGVIMVNREGRIVAYIGGKEFIRGTSLADDELDTPDDTPPAPPTKAVIIDLMNKKAKVPPASTIKPVIAYYTMLVDNKTLESGFADKPIEYKYLEREGKKVWLPRNWYPYDAKGQGLNRYLGRHYTLLEAQVLSVNTIFARLYSKPTIRNAMLAGFDRVGLEYNHEDAKYWPFGIGASAVPVQQWLGVYRAFLDGFYRPPSFVRRIMVNNEVVYDASREIKRSQIPLFDARQERTSEMQALYEVCNRGSGASMRRRFSHHKNLVSGKTGTAPNGRASLFVSHFNPYRNRSAHPGRTLTTIVVVTTNTGGYKSVGASTEGPTQVAGAIYDYLFQKELQAMIDARIEAAKQSNLHFSTNHLYWANTNRYMETLLEGKCGDTPIHEYINGVDGYQEALEQILNPDNRIYAGNNELFRQLVKYYCDQGKRVRMR